MGQVRGVIEWAGNGMRRYCLALLPGAIAWRLGIEMGCGGLQAGEAQVFL